MAGEEESIPKRFETPIEVPPDVLEGLEAVRGSGQTDMLDLQTVQTIAALIGYSETARWLEAHRREYTEGIFRGFVVAQ